LTWKRGMLYNENIPLDWCGFEVSSCRRAAGLFLLR